LAAIRAGAKIRPASKLTGVDCVTLYRWRWCDPTLDALFLDALLAGKDRRRLRAQLANDSTSVPEGGSRSITEGGSC
jgi:hypothetical protein